MVVIVILDKKDSVNLLKECFGNELALTSSLISKTDDKNEADAEH